VNKITTLSNGLRVVTEEFKSRQSIAIGFWVGVGGRFESDPLKGAAHFLEHIVFKGSKKYSCGQIKEKIEGVGGALNAFTGEEQTCYYAKIPSQHLETTFDVLADMVFFPKITPTDVKKESTVIIEEIKMYNDLPQYHALELLDQLVWPGHPLGKGLAGSKETVASMTNQDLKAFHKLHYSPGNIVVSACGNISHARLVKMVKAKIGTAGAKRTSEFKKCTAIQSSPRAKYAKRPIEQMHMALGAPGIDVHSKDKYVLALLNTILGGNMSSRLFVEIREKKGLAYSISSSAKCLQDTGMFLIRAGVDNLKIVGALSVIFKELERIKKTNVSADEFKRAKDYVLGQLLLGLEDTMDNMLWIAEEVTTRNKVRTLKTIVDEFKKIKPADIKRLANIIFDKNKYNLAVVGPLTPKQEKDLNQLMNIDS